jgi:hypothetical protein
VNDLPTHLALFAFIGLVIVVMGAFYADAEDAPVWRALPRRLATFFGGCAVLVVIMLICEHTFAALG